MKRSKQEQLKNFTKYEEDPTVHVVSMYQTKQIDKNDGNVVIGTWVLMSALRKPGIAIYAQNGIILLQLVEAKLENRLISLIKTIL